MVHIIPALKGSFTSSVNRTFFFTLSFLFFVGNEHNTMSSLSQSMAFSQFFCYCCCDSFPNNPYSYAFFSYDGSIPRQIFYFFSHSFLFSYIFLLFHFYFWDIFYLQVCGHAYHTSGTAAYIINYMLLSFYFFHTCDSIFVNHIYC